MGATNKRERTESIKKPLSKGSGVGGTTTLFIVLSSLIFIVTTTVVVLISYGMYRDAFYNYSNELCLGSNAQAAYVINGDLVQHYAETLTVDEQYEILAEKLDQLKERISAKYFYILVDNGVPGMYTYIYDATHSEEFPGEKYALGRNETKAEYEGADEVLRTGAGFEKALYYNDVYGELYYAYAPIFNSSGEVVAFVGTDVDIAQLHQGLRAYRQKLLLTLIVTCAVFLTIFLIVVRRAHVNPMNTIAKKATRLSDTLSIMENILNGMDAYIYVSDLQTDEILFVNDKMKAHFGLADNAVGEICWKVLQTGMTQRCSFCPIGRLLHDPGTPIQWEEHNSVTGRFYKNNDCIIEWTGGKKAHMQHSVDITELKSSEQSLKKRLDQQELMSSISQSYIADSDMESFIGNAFRLTGEFMGVSRIMLAEYDEKEQVLKYRHAWSSQAAAHLSANVGGVLSFHEGSPLHRILELKKKDVLAVGDVESTVEFERARQLGMKAFLTVPVSVSGRFWGILEFDRFDSAYDWSESDIHLGKILGNTFSAVLTRQIMEEDKRAAQEQIMRMSYIINSSPQYISYINKDGAYEFFNPATLEAGYSYDELMAGGLRLLCDDETYHFVVDTILPAVFEKGQCDFEIPIRKKDGESRILSVSAFVIDSDKSACGTISSDITEKKKLELELIEARDAAEQASRAKGEFLSRMSHEMRTPMNAIIGMTNIAKDSADAGKIAHCLERIDVASKHLLGVINDILDMSKIEANKFELYKQEFDVEKTLMNVMNVVNFRAEEKRQNLVVNLGKDVPLSLIGDELRLTQVITNLLTNAVKFTDKGGTILLNVSKVAEQGKTVTIQTQVVDSGIGIAANDLPRLFNSFEQADGGISRRFGGTGLGLAISRRIVELMGGRIWVESQPGKGSTFTFTANMEMGRQKPNYSLPSSVHKEDLHILAVDDSAETRDYFLHIMETFGISCDTAADGFEALHLMNKCADKPYNIFFVDWQMPGMNGIELTKKIKEQTEDKAVIIMISVTEWNEIEAEATKAGVDHFISKPLFPSTLIDSINKCLGAERGVKPRQTVLPKHRHRFKDHTILLAEDMDVNREIICSMLEGTGISIDFAETGRQAVSMFAHNPGKYSLILMDIQMPEMDGFEAARYIRSLGRKEAKGIPIIAMTANVFREDVESCLAAGMNSHVGKPVDADDLLEKLSLYLINTTPKEDTMNTELHTGGAQQEKAPIDYAAFLPDIDIQDGLGRLMNNKKLYLKLLKSFGGKQMADEIVAGIQKRDFAQTARTAHALKGVSSNLGFMKLTKVVTDIETQAKAEMDSTQFIDELCEAVDGVMRVIGMLLENEEM